VCPPPPPPRDRPQDMLQEQVLGDLGGGASQLSQQVVAGGAGGAQPLVVPLEDPVVTQVRGGRAVARGVHGSCAWGRAPNMCVLQPAAVSCVCLPRHAEQCQHLNTLFPCTDLAAWCCNSTHTLPE
jgi:hypothetical protein